MFSLIITLISIALVAALALATLYYGGSAYQQGAAKADAAKILLQGQQLIGASELYLAGEGHWPKDLPALKNSKYLTSTPHARAMQAAVEQAHAAGVEWLMPKDNTPMFLLPAVAGKDVCRYVNVQGSLKNDGIPKLAYRGLTIQCFGDGAYQVVIKKDASTPLAGGTPDIAVGATPLPNPDPASSDWDTKPGEVVSGTVPPGTPTTAVPGSGILEYSVDGQVVTRADIDLPEGETYNYVTVSIRNASSSDVTFTSGWSIAPPFLIDPDYNECAGVTLKPGYGPDSTCLVDIDYQTLEIQGHTANLQPLTPTAGVAGLPVRGGPLSTFPGVPSGLAFTVPEVQFPVTAPGAVTTVQVQLTNASTVPVTLTGFTSTQPGVFAPTHGVPAPSCAALSGGALPAGSTGTLGVTFSPATPGSSTAELLVTAAYPNGTDTFSLPLVLKGTSVVPVDKTVFSGWPEPWLLVEPHEADLGQVVRGTPYTSTHVLTNTTGLDIPLVETDRSADTSVSGCQTVPANSSCSISVTFTPTWLNNMSFDGELAEPVFVRYNLPWFPYAESPDSAAELLLSNTATLRGLVGPPNVYNSGTVVKMNSNTTNTYTITNYAETATPPVVAIVTTTTVSGMTVISDTCNGNPIASGGSCTVQVRYAGVQSSLDDPYLRYEVSFAGYYNPDGALFYMIALGRHY